MDPESSTLAALITGALTRADLDGLPEDAFASPPRRWAFLALCATPGARGRPPTIDALVLALGVRRLPRGRLSLVIGPLFWRTFLVDLARQAPRRRAALDALASLRAAWREREDLERDRERIAAALVEVAEGAALAWLRQLSEDGGIAYEGGTVRRGEAWEGRWPVRPVELGAIPRRRDLRWLLAGAMRAAAEREDAERAQVATWGELAAVEVTDDAAQIEEAG